jgi:hypothetical protein
MTANTDDRTVAAIVAAAMGRLITLLQRQAHTDQRQAAAYEAAARQAEQERRTWIAYLQQAPEAETWIKTGPGAAGYPIDLFAALEPGETIADVSITAEAGAQIDSVLIAPTVITVYISGGRPGDHATITANATTDRGRPITRAIGLIVSEEPIEIYPAPEAGAVSHAEALRIAAIGADLDDALCTLITTLHDAAQRRPAHAAAYEAAANEIDTRRQQWQNLIIEILEAAT